MTAISYQTVCETLDLGIGGTKLDCVLKAHLQAVDAAHMALGKAEPIDVTAMSQYSTLYHHKPWYNIKVQTIK